MYINIFSQLELDSTSHKEFHGDKCKTIESARKRCRHLANKNQELYSSAFFIIITDTKFNRNDWDEMTLPDGIRDNVMFYWDEATERVFAG